MELELKHLAAYLPYKLRFKDSYAGDTSTYTLSSNQLAHWESGHIKPFLPILRPLSDLTKEIEVSGVKFVPIEWLTNMAYINYEMGLLTIDKDMNIKDYFKLLEWHFDVFGLIENGLAIDINNLK